MSTGNMVFRLKNDSAPAKAEGEENKGVDLSPDALGEQKQVSDPAPVVSEAGVKEIVLKAPIGHAVTEAINILLNRKDNKSGTMMRTEGSMMQMVASGLSEAEEEELTPSEANKAYIFVQDGRRMNLGEIDTMINAAVSAREGGAGYVGVVVEGLDETRAENSSAAEFISEGILHMESYGVKVMYSPMTAMTSLEKFLGVY